mgnify:CR=1 FL=1|jgi:hypothetical protein
MNKKPSPFQIKKAPGKITVMALSIDPSNIKEPVSPIAQLKLEALHFYAAVNVVERHPMPGITWFTTGDFELAAKYIDQSPDKSAARRFIQGAIAGQRRDYKKAVEIWDNLQDMAEGLKSLRRPMFILAKNRLLKKAQLDQ